MVTLGVSGSILTGVGVCGVSTVTCCLCNATKRSIFCCWEYINLSISDCLALLISSCWYMAPRVLCRLKAIGAWCVGLVCVADVDVLGDVGADCSVGCLNAEAVVVTSMVTDIGRGHLYHPPH